MNAFETIFQNSRDANFLLDQKKLIKCNPSALHMFGVKEDISLINTPLLDLSPENQAGGEDSYIKFEAMLKLTHKKGVHHFSWIYKRFNQELFFTEVTLTRIFIEESVLIHIAIKDISREKNRIDLMSYYQELLLKQMELKISNISDSLQSTTELVSKALNISHISIWLFNENKTQLECQDYYDVKLRKHTILEAINKDQDSAYFSSIEQAKTIIINDIRNHPLVSKIHTDFIRMKQINSIMKFPIIQKAEVIGNICFSTDKGVRQWKLEEQEFAFSIAHVIALLFSDYKSQKTEDKFRKISHILDHSQTIVFYWKAEENWPVEYVTHNISMFGYSQEDFYSGRIQYSDIIHHDDIRDVSKEVETHTQGNLKHFTQVYRIITADKQVRWIDDRTEIERDDKGKVLYYFGTIIDITSQKEAEQLSQKVLQENINQAKILAQQSKLASMGEMVSNIAHQWRQPLSALSLMLQKLELLKKRETLSDEELSKTLSKGLLTIDKMSTTIDDFRNFFQPNKEKQTFLILECLHEAERLTSTMLYEYNITLDIHVKPHLQVHGFKNELSQVILNILNNAKDACIENQTKNATINIYSKENKDELCIYIRNNGGTIAEDKISKIFEPYYSTKDEGKGTGIGLYMSKTIIQDHMMGHLSVMNINDGVEFKISFPR